MVRIVKVGVPEADHYYTYTCRKCATVFEFKRSEARFAPCQPYPDVLEIQCPVCVAFCWVPV